MTCTVCKGPIEPGRVRIGMSTCLACGDAAACREIELKRTQVGSAFNKGGLQFLGGANFKQNALDAGRKTSAELNDVVTQAAPRAKRAKFQMRKRVGVMWNKRGDAFALFEGDDPKDRGAVRFVLW